MPTVPCATPYDGDVQEIRNFLEEEKPVNWLEELSKLEDMSEAGNTYRALAKDDWPVKFRAISRDTVLPRQVRVRVFS